MPCNHEERYGDTPNLPEECGDCLACYAEYLLNSLEDLESQTLSIADQRSKDIIEGWKDWHRGMAAMIPGLNFVERSCTRRAVERLIANQKE